MPEKKMNNKTWFCKKHLLQIGADFKECPICEQERKLKYKVKIKGRFLPNPFWGKK